MSNSHSYVLVLIHTTKQKKKQIDKKFSNLWSFKARTTTDSFEFFYNHHLLYFLFTNNSSNVIILVLSEVLCDVRLEAAVPCNQCSRVAFCSVACQTVALTTHHVVECPILETLWSSGASITCLMALRMLSQRGLKYFLDMKDILEKVCA